MIPKKFRVFYKGKMYVPELMSGNGELCTCIIKENPDDDVVQSIIISTKENPLLQYTGAKDKSSKEIYEGDIVKRDGMIFVVKYGVFDAYWCEVFGYMAISQPSGYISKETMQSDTIEVIGNIYNNPEMIPKEEE